MLTQFFEFLIQLSLPVLEIPGLLIQLVVFLFRLGCVKGQGPVDIILL